MFKDSLNFVPLRLGSLPVSLGFEGSKGWFPHYLIAPKITTTKGRYPM
jgi:hypothetical protein